MTDKQKRRLRKSLARRKKENNKIKLDNDWLAFWNKNRGYKYGQ